MLETEETDDQTATSQFRRALKDGIDYFGSVISLVQARAAELALSSLLFAALLVLASVLGFAALVLVIVAAGFWLTHATGHVGWALLILGGVSALIAWLSIWRALRWLDNLKS
jgi:hypothetical protein